MDSSPPHYNQHFSHAQSSPNLFSAYRPQPQNESSSSDVANSSSSPFQPPLRRGISDNVPTAASTRYANSAANHARRFPQVEGSHSGGGGEDGAATRETWMDFLRGTGSGDPSGNSRENNYTPNRSFVERNAGLDPLGLESVEQSEPTGFARYPRNRFDPTERYTRRNLNLTFDGAADHPPGMNLSSSSVARHPPPRHSSMQFDAAQTSSSPLATTAALAAYRERKRRLTDITPSGREGGSGPRTSIAGPTVIDLTSSPEGPRRMTVTRRGSAGGPAGSRRTSSSGMSGTAVARPGSSSRNGTGRERNAQEEATRRPSDIVLPKWQPDSEVTKCPVCSNAFSFFYRKHHCRKCGRVVCANCSPHRITIPRQFIVQPPPVIDLTDDMDTSPSRFANPALGGGAEVRVCNPCVPDPNFNPPPQDQPPPYQPSPLQSFLQHDPFWDATPDEQRRRQAQHQSAQAAFGAATGLQQPWLPGIPDQQAQSSDIFRNRRISFNNPSSAADLFPPPVPHAPRDGLPASRPANAALPLGHPGASRLSSPPGISDHLVPSRGSSRTHRAHHSTGTAGAAIIPSPSNQHPQSGHRYRSLLDPLPPIPPLSAPPLAVPPRGIRAPPPPQRQVQPRRQVAEEDECPVCGSELPPKGPNGEMADRERHVEECIASHFVGGSSTASPSARPASTAIPSARIVAGPPGAPPSDVAGASASSAPNLIAGFARPSSEAGRARAESSAAAAAGGEQVQPRRRRATGNRMLIYTATEKDCVGEDGEPAECIICFEEFEPGVELGRLECLCKFHRTCIRQWWDTKGIGSCPTHQLHD